MHEAIFAAVQGREGMRTDELPFFQFGGTYRSGLGIAGCTFTAGFGAAASAGPDSPSPSSPCGDTHVEKEGVAKPEQDDPYNYKNQNFKDILHNLVCVLGAPSIKV